MCRWGNGLNSMRQGLWQAGLRRLRVKGHVENLEAFPVSACNGENPQCSVIRGFQGLSSQCPEADTRLLISRMGASRAWPTARWWKAPGCWGPTEAGHCKQSPLTSRWNQRAVFTVYEGITTVGRAGAVPRAFLGPPALGNLPSNLSLSLLLLGPAEQLLCPGPGTRKIIKYLRTLK